MTLTNEEILKNYQEHPKPAFELIQQQLQKTTTEQLTHTSIKMKIIYFEYANQLILSNLLESAQLLSLKELISSTVVKICTQLDFKQLQSTKSENYIQAIQNYQQIISYTIQYMQQQTIQEILTTLMNQINKFAFTLSNKQQPPKQFVYISDLLLYDQQQIYECDQPATVVQSVKQIFCIILHQLIIYNQVLPCFELIQKLALVQLAQNNCVILNLILSTLLNQTQLYISNLISPYLEYFPTFIQMISTEIYLQSFQIDNVQQNENLVLQSNILQIIYYIQYQIKTNTMSIKQIFQQFNSSRDIIGVQDKYNEFIENTKILILQNDQFISSNIKDNIFNLITVLQQFNLQNSKIIQQNQCQHQNTNSQIFLVNQINIGNYIQLTNYKAKQFEFEQHVLLQVINRITIKMIQNINNLQKLIQLDDNNRNAFIKQIILNTNSGQSTNMNLIQFTDCHIFTLYCQQIIKQMILLDKNVCEQLIIFIHQVFTQFLPTLHEDIIKDVNEQYASVERLQITQEVVCTANSNATQDVLKIIKKYFSIISIQLLINIFTNDKQIQNQYLHQLIQIVQQQTENYDQIQQQQLSNVIIQQLVHNQTNQYLENEIVQQLGKLLDQMQFLCADNIQMKAQFVFAKSLTCNNQFEQQRSTLKEVKQQPDENTKQTSRQRQSHSKKQYLSAISKNVSSSFSHRSSVDNTSFRLVDKNAAKCQFITVGQFDNQMKVEKRTLGNYFEDLLEELDLVEAYFCDEAV